MSIVLRCTSIFKVTPYSLCRHVGWNHLYLFDTNTRKLINAITSGEWVVRKVVEVDEAKRRLWLINIGMGINTQGDPYFQHFCSVNFDGSDMKTLTDFGATHRVALSPTRRFFVDEYSKFDLPRTQKPKCSETERTIAEIGKDDLSDELKRIVRESRKAFVARGHGMLYFPTNFDQNKSYPVIQWIYSSPHTSHVVKSFSQLVGVHELTELGLVGAMSALFCSIVGIAVKRLTSVFPLRN